MLSKQVGGLGSWPLPFSEQRDPFPDEAYRSREQAGAQRGRRQQNIHRRQKERGGGTNDNKQHLERSHVLGSVCVFLARLWGKSLELTREPAIATTGTAATPLAWGKMYFQSHCFLQALG